MSIEKLQPDKPYTDFRVLRSVDFDFITDAVNVLKKPSREDAEIRAHQLGLDINEEGQNAYTLQSGLIVFAVELVSQRTNISFLKSEDLTIERRSLYDLFFHNLPEAIYANSGSVPPSREFIQNATVAKIKHVDSVGPLRWSLGNPHQKEEFDDFLDLSNYAISSVSLETSSKDMFPYSLTLPNVKGGSADVLFSLSSYTPITEEVMDVLLKLHKFGYLEGESSTFYAEKFSAGINCVREALRT